MKPLKLHLKGFKGIRDGMRQGEILLDLQALTSDAQLVALVGPNGAGKSTIMDNLHPYRLMPSRATSYSPAGFSYYDQLCAPEGVKDLEWRHNGRRFRSQLVFRVNGTSKTEAYLHEWVDGRWTPATLPDGTRSDGKTATYDRCVEYLLGTPDAFFTSVFSAQNRRPLSSYKTGEIKALMVDLLQLDHIKERGVAASAVANLLKMSLEERRGDTADLERNRAELASLETRKQAAEKAMASAHEDKRAAVAALDQCREVAARLRADRDNAAENDQRRARLGAKIAEAQATAAKAVQALVGDRGRLVDTRGRLARELDGAERTATHQRAVREQELLKNEDLLSRKLEIDEAVATAEALAGEASQLEADLSAARERQAECTGLRRQLELVDTKKAGLEREAGAASLRAQNLRTRFGLTAEVPCQGTDLQGQCKLLGDARDAQALLPSAEGDISRIQAQVAELVQERGDIEKSIAGLGDVDRIVRTYEQQKDSLVKRLRAAEAVAGLKPSLDQAQERVGLLTQEIADIEAHLEETKGRIAAELARTVEEIGRIGTRIGEEEAGAQASLQELRAELASLPPAFASDQLGDAERALASAQAAMDDAEARHIAAVHEQATLGARIQAAQATVEAGKGSMETLAALEAELATWTLLAKAMSNDGVIALCIDDAGPTLAKLTNELLQSCYGPRFTVSIVTQIETAKKDLKEGFDIRVFDADSGESKSVTDMSGGQKVWINECLTRAIAIYLAQASGHRYQTLFTDEVDGPLDPERKRMFMAMKREVLRAGGYEQEFFVSQTPELWEMADCVIDLASLSECA